MFAPRLHSFRSTLGGLKEEQCLAVSRASMSTNEMMLDKRVDLYLALVLIKEHLNIIKSFINYGTALFTYIVCCVVQFDRYIRSTLMYKVGIFVCILLRNKERDLMF